MEASKIKESMIKVSPGDFKSFGLFSLEGNTPGFILTFIGKVGVKIKIYSRKEKVLEEITPSPDCFRGRVCSVTLEGEIEGLFYCICDRNDTPDPYSRLIYGRNRWKNHTKEYSVFMANPLSTPEYLPDDFSSWIIYKLHLRGFFANSLGEDYSPWSELIKKIPYFKKLGINTLEFMPLYEFNELPENGEERLNYWGYGNHGTYFFAPKASYFGGEDSIHNLRKMISTLHKNGINVIMEFCFGKDVDQVLAVSAIRYWALFYNVDGFRLIGDNVPLQPLVKDPFLADKALIFEGYNGEYLSQGEKKHIFCGDNSFMFPLRRLQNHMEGQVSELFEIVVRQKEDFGFVNRISSVSGFTLYDAYSYCDKHNEANGEEGRDGESYNCSSNYGIEGDTRDKSVLRERYKSIRTAFATLLMSRGIPQIQAGDEVLNSALGNNNPYCQDNPVGWTVFSRKKDAIAMREYVRKLIEFRKAHPVLFGSNPLQMNDYKRLGMPDMSIHGKQPWKSNMEEQKKLLGILFSGNYVEKDDDIEHEDLMILFNFYYESEEISLPRFKNKSWHLVTDTSSYDFYEEPLRLKKQDKIELEGGTMQILISKNG